MRGRDEVLDVVAEARERHAVARAELFGEGGERLARLLDRSPCHGARAVDEDPEARLALGCGCVARGGCGRRHRGGCRIALRGLYEDAALRRGNAFEHDRKVSVRIGLQELHFKSVAFVRDPDPVAGRSDGRRFGKPLAKAVGGLYRIGSEAVRFRLLVRQQRIRAIAGRDCGRQRHAHPAVDPVQGLGRAELDCDRVARLQVPEVRGEEPLARALDHERKIARVDRLLVGLFGFVLRQRLGFEPLVSDHGSEPADRGLQRERKGVGGFDRLLAAVHEVLTNAGGEQHPAGLALDLDPRERDADAFGPIAPEKFRTIDFDDHVHSSSLSCSS